MDEMRGEHRGALNRATVVQAALRLLDEVGLDALSVRRLAAELGVKSPALYWHFRSKQELLNEMSEALQLSQDLTGPRPGESCRQWLARRARERRRLLLRHRDGARLISGTATGPAVLARFDAELAVLVQAGLAPVQALRSVLAIGHYVTGFVLAEQSELQAEAPDSMAPDLLAERAPHLAAAIGAGGDPQGEDAFEHGLRMLVSGLEDGGR